MSVNTDKFVAQIDDEVAAGNLEGAKELCRNTRGPVASIFYQGLDRADQGSIDIVEKSVVSYGSVQMGTIRKRLGMVIAIYRFGSNAWFHGYGNWYDWCI